MILNDPYVLSDILTSYWPHTLNQDDWKGNPKQCPNPSKEKKEGTRTEGKPKD